MPRPKGPEKEKHVTTLLATTSERLRQKAETAGFRTVAAYIADYFDSDKDLEPKKVRDEEVRQVVPTQAQDGKIVHRVGIYPARTDEVIPRFKKNVGK